MRRGKDRPFPYVSILLINKWQAKAGTRSYHEHVMNFIDCFFAHLHCASLDALAIWDLQRTPSMMRRIHHLNEFRLFDFLEWLVTCYNPLCKTLFKLFLIPGSLSNA